jgi:hypothetical protein
VQGPGFLDGGDLRGRRRQHRGIAASWG